MSAAVLPVFITEFLVAAGEFTAEVGAEVGLSEGASNFLGAAVTAKATSELTGTIDDGFQTAVNRFVGKDKVDSAKKTVNDYIEDAKAVLSQDTGHFTGTSQSGVHLSTHHSQTKTPPVQKTNIIDFENQDPRNIQNVNIKTYADSDIIDSNSGIDSTSDPIVMLGADPTPQPTKVNYSPNDVARFIVKYASAIASQNSLPPGESISKEKAVTEVLLENPQYIDLAPIIGSFLNNRIPTNDAYKQIAQVYNGLGMEINKNCFRRFDKRKGLYYFILVNEKNDQEVLYQTTGITIPAFPGTSFVGPKSPNVNMPTNLSDLYAAFHDYSYSNGPNLTGDYQFISRLSQNYGRMDTYSQKVARMSILYFSTLGSSISSIFGSAPTNIATNPTNIPITDDIYTVLNPITSEFGSLNNGGTSVPLSQLPQQSGQQMAVDRSQFYKDLQDSIEAESVTSSILSSVSGYSSKFIAEDFGSLEISLD